jgi:hypothetical protein
MKRTAQRPKTVKIQHFTLSPHVKLHAFSAPESAPILYRIPGSLTEYPLHTPLELEAQAAQQRRPLHARHSPAFCSVTATAFHVTGSLTNAIWGLMSQRHKQIKKIATRWLSFVFGISTGQLPKEN